jgi:hypothetical protein
MTRITDTAFAWLEAEGRFVEVLGKPEDLANGKAASPKLL